MRRARLLAAVVAAAALLVLALAGARGPSDERGAPAAEDVAGVPGAAVPSSAPAVESAAQAAAGAGTWCRGGEDAACGARERPIAELAGRLQGDPVRRSTERPPGPGAEAARVAAGRAVQRRLCRGVTRRATCSLAVAGSIVRRTWRGLRRGPDRRRTAEVLVGVGGGMGLTPTEVVNAVRAELDAQLTRQLDAGELTQRAYRRALACYDAAGGCGWAR